MVDDEQVIREVGRELLNMIGFDVLVAGDGLEALEIFEQKINEIDLVMLDLAMPRLNGGDTLKEIRKKSQVPVIMDTGYKIMLGFYVNFWGKEVSSIYTDGVAPEYYAPGKGRSLHDENRILSALIMG